MDTNIAEALRQGGVVDITTVGARSGQERRIEINFHHFDGEFFITGKPGFPRDWLANLVANPGFTLHLKHGVEADLAASAAPISDVDVRSRVLYRILTESWQMAPEDAKAQLDRWVTGSPLVRFSLAT